MLDTKFQNYLKLLPTQQDGHGFIEATTGDSLIFTGLVGCVAGVEVDIDAARMGDIWFRHPVQYPAATSSGYLRGFWRRVLDCLKLKTTNVAALQAEFTRGNSTISRDQLTGLAWYCWHNKRQDLAEHVVQYALKHWGFMGKGDPTKTNVMPGLLATYAWISYKLGGPSRAWLRWIPADFGGTPADYEAHLQVLHILLRKQVTGKISAFASDTLQNQVNREPLNPLFQLAVGNDGMCEALLDNPGLWPNDRLPTTADRLEPWLPQRDNGPDWKPSAQAPAVTHHGADFLFVYALMNNLLKSYAYLTTTGDIK